LHFANVIAEDAHLGQLYGCTLYNYVFRGFVQGDDQVVSPELLPGIGHTSNVVVVMVLSCESIFVHFFSFSFGCDSVAAFLLLYVF
jgi:hypothetical protein